MENNNIDQVPPPLPPNYKPFEPAPGVVLITTFGMFLAGSVLGTMLYLPFAYLFDWMALFSSGGIDASDSAHDRLGLRIMAAFSQLGSFLLPGLFLLWLFYRRRSPLDQHGWGHYLRSNVTPAALVLFLSCILMLVATPMTYKLYEWNKMLPMPDFLKEMEVATEAVLKRLLVMDNVWELLLMVVIIGLLPALGEEIIFRGLIQQQLMRVMRNPWVAIVVASAIFSAMHLQMEGFFSRMFLGMILGFLYYQTKSFWAPAAAHFFNNSTQVIGQYLFRKELSVIDFEKDIEVPWYGVIASVVLSALICWLIILLSRSNARRQ